jgi:hypothetical protein
MSRWLLTSNKSPLTGAILLHKDLVPNYMLLSSLQEAAKAAAKTSSSNDVSDDAKMAKTKEEQSFVEEEEITSDVSLSGP